MFRHLFRAAALALAVASSSACGGADPAPADPAAAAAPPAAAPAPVVPPAPAPVPAPAGPAPVVLGRNRNGCPPTGGVQVLFVGTGLVGDATVTFGGVPATGVALDAVTGGLLATAPAHADGYVDVVVTNPDGRSGTSPRFHYGPPPAIADFAPRTGVRPGDLVTVTGADFDVTAGVQVIVGGVIAVVSSRTPTELVFVAPKVNPLPYYFAVSNADGQYATSPVALAYQPGP